MGQIQVEAAGITSSELDAGLTLTGSSATDEIPQNMLAQTANIIAIKTVFLLKTSIFFFEDIC